jgi:hypothetical protein
MTYGSVQRAAKRLILPTGCVTFVSLCTSRRSLTCRKILRHGADGRLYFPYEESRATDFIALKNLSSSAGFEPANLGLNRK